LIAHLRPRNARSGFATHINALVVFPREKTSQLQVIESIAALAL
jgi:hypothetical protein